MAINFSFCQLVILLSLSVKFTTVSCDTFYIVTSPSSPCPGEYIGVPCLTLQQYASNPSRSQNVTFIIEPGVYNLSTVLTVSDGYNFTMSSTNATVTCISATASLEFNRVQNVHISGMTFQGCRNGAAVQITAATNTAIIGSLFIRNSAGIQISQATRAIVMGNNFTENHVSCLQASDSSITIDGNIFTKNRGSCLQASASTLTIDDGNFTDNGICLHVSSSSVTINDSKFYKCVPSIYQYGGGAHYKFKTCY